MGVVCRAVLFSSGRNSKERVLFYCCDTLRNPNMGSDRTYISSSVSSFSPCLPGDPCSSPSASFVLAPSEVGLSPRQRSFEPILSFFYLTKNIRSGVWTASLSVISHVSQPFCTWTDRTMKAENWRTMWDQMFHLKFAASKKST